MFPQGFLRLFCCSFHANVGDAIFQIAFAMADKSAAFVESGEVLLGGNMDKRLLELFVHKAKGSIQHFGSDTLTTMIHADADTADGGSIVIDNTLGEDAQIGGSFSLFIQGKEMPGLLVGIVDILFLLVKFT